MRVPPPVPRLTSVQVVRGDTLSALAQRFGVTVSQLARLNGIKNPDRIFAGHRLWVPTVAESCEAPRPVSPLAAKVVPAPWSPRTSSSADRTLRYVSAATSTTENALRLVQRKVGAVGAVGALTALARLPGDVRKLQADVRTGGAPDVAESGLKVARNVVRAVRGLEEVACAFGVKTFQRLVPGVGAGAAGLDAALAASAHANPKASTVERAVADFAALGSAISAKSRNPIGPMAGIVSAGLGLWRDALSDDRRAAPAGVEAPND